MLVGRFSGPNAVTFAPAISILPSLEASEHAQQGRLSAAGRPENGEEIPRGDGKIQGMDGGHRTEALGNAGKPDERLGQSLASGRISPPSMTSASATTALALSSTNAPTMPSPMPRAPPMTTARFPSSAPVMLPSVESQSVGLDLGRN
jgi:hypothetical protein